VILHTNILSTPEHTIRMHHQAIPQCLKNFGFCLWAHHLSETHHLSERCLDFPGTPEHEVHTLCSQTDSFLLHFI